MRAVLLPGDSTVEIVKRDRPTPGLGQVIVQIKAAGLCGSDVHMLYRTPKEKRAREIMRGLTIDPNIIAGHEPAGVVVDIGEGVTHISPGDRVAVAHISGCGTCLACRRGWDIDCPNKQTYGFDRDGAMSDFMVADAKDCALLPASVSFTEGAFYACGAGTGYWALKRGGLSAGEVVVVVGLGPVGLAAAYFAAASGARVIGIDPVLERREFALSHGVHHAIDAMDANALDRVLELSGGRGADLAIDASGSSPGRVSALRSARVRGRVVFVGFGAEQTNVDIGTDIIQKQLSVIGSWVYSTPELQEMILDASERGLSVEPLIVHRYDADDADRAWMEFDEGSLGKSMLVWED
ncbi:zinc-binding dehydrogenase [Pseudarthrobacter oxydans]|uniref:zinc-binding dehydrogenase n=1 Tax=Pseudarthrobacter oxydans TaxID=1671 RepID=UPI00344DEF9E